MSGLFTALRPATANVDVSPQSPPEQMQWLLGSAAGDFSRPDSGSGPPPSWSTQATVPDFGSSSILPASATSSQADLSVAQPPATSNNGPRKGSARPPSAPGRFTPTPAPTVVESRPATFPRQSGATRKTPAGSVSKAAAKPMSKGKRYLLPGDHIASCVECGSPIAHLQLRGDDEAFAVQWEGVWSCKACLERRGVDTIAQAAEKVKKKRSRYDSSCAFSHGCRQTIDSSYLNPDVPAERCARPMVSSSATSASNPVEAAVSLPLMAEAPSNLPSKCAFQPTSVARRASTELLVPFISVCLRFV